MKVVIRKVSQIALFCLLIVNGVLASQGKIIEIERSIYIDVPREKLWKITGEEFAQVDKWISGVNASFPIEGSVNGSNVKARTCDPSYKGFKETTEELLVYDQANYILTYRIVEGMPGFVKAGANTWTHEPQGKGTRMTMRAKLEVKGPAGAMMKGVMKRKMGTIIEEALEELKLYAETGEQHPRKKEAMLKYKKERSKKEKKQKKVSWVKPFRIDHSIGEGWPVMVYGVGKQVKWPCFFV